MWTEIWIRKHIWFYIRDYWHDGIHLYLIQQVFYRYSGTWLENDLIQQKNKLFFIINANRLCRHIMSLSLLHTKCPIIRNGASSSPSLPLHMHVYVLLQTADYVFVCILHGPPAAKFGRCRFFISFKPQQHTHILKTISD